MADYDFLDDLDEDMLQGACGACEELDAEDDYVKGMVDLLLHDSEHYQRDRYLLADYLVGNREPKTFIVTGEEVVETTYRVQCYSARQAVALVRRGEAERIDTVSEGKFLDRLQAREEAD